MSQVAAPAAGRAAPVPRTAVPGFHLGLAVLMTAIVLAGFWPFYAALLTGGAGARAVMYAHAAVFSGWLVLLLAQTSLVFRRRVAAHRSLGRLGIWYGLGLLLFGLYIAFAFPVVNVMSGGMTLDQAAAFLLLPIGDMLLFGGFFIAGIVARRDREAHRRLMVLAAVALIFPGAARFAAPAGLAPVLGLWLLPLLAAMAHDGYLLRRVHRVYAIGLALCLLTFARVFLMETAPWLAIGRRILTALLPAVPPA